MSERIWDRSLVLTAIAVALVSVATLWLGWSTSANALARFSLPALAPVFGAALVSYSLRILRFHYFLSHSGVAISLRNTIVVQMVGLAFVVTPGRVGEVFKLHLIRERTGTPIVQTAPLLLLDRLTEGSGFLILAIVSGMTLPSLREQIPMPTLILLGLAAMCAFGLTWRRWSSRVSSANLSPKVSPIWQRLAPHLRNFWRGLETSFSPPQILGGLALSVLARFADGLVVLFAAQMMGAEIALPAAVFVLAVSGLAGGISFLPAGIGAVETTMAGLLTLLGLTWSNALAIALVARLFTLWEWVALGLVLTFLLWLPSRRARISEGEES